MSDRVADAPALIEVDGGGRTGRLLAADPHASIAWRRNVMRDAVAVNDSHSESPMFCAPALPPTSNRLASEDLPPAAISSIIAKPI
jgi:hypothetical protein